MLVCADYLKSLKSQKQMVFLQMLQVCSDDVSLAPASHLSPAAAVLDTGCLWGKQRIFSVLSNGLI